MSTTSSVEQTAVAEVAAEPQQDNVKPPVRFVKVPRASTADWSSKVPWSEMYAAAEAGRDGLSALTEDDFKALAEDDLKRGGYAVYREGWRPELTCLHRQGW